MDLTMFNWIIRRLQTMGSTIGSVEIHFNNVSALSQMQTSNHGFVCLFGS